MALRSADCVTTISQGLRKELIRAHGHTRDRGDVVVIPNGFNRVNTLSKGTAPSEDSILRIGYTGSMYAGRRDAGVLFRALAEVLSDLRMSKSSVEFHYAGNDGSIVRDQASRFGMADTITDWGFVSRTDALRIQDRSDLLLVLSWNDPGEEGILTGKVFEYMMSGTPIISLSGGSIPDSELTSLIERHDLGVAYENATHEKDYSILRCFLRDAIETVCIGGGTMRSNNLDSLREYDYANLSRRLERVLVSLS